MKTNLLTIFSCFVLFYGCSKSSDTQPANNTTSQPTQLELTVLNSVGNAVPNSTVELYANQTDWQNRTNQVVTSQTTGVNGKVLFTVNPATYYWYVYNGCMTNTFGTTYSANQLTANQKNSFQTIINNVGNLKIVNNSTNPYHVYINGTLYGDLTSNTYYNLVAKENSYAVRVLQISGYVLTPTDKTFNVNVTCGNVTIVNFP